MTKDNMHERISDISIGWQSSAPYLAEYLLRFKYDPTSGVNTMGVSIKDNHVILAYNPEFVEQLSRSDLEGVLFHEILHVLHKFHDRISNRQHDIFNVSQDACINEIVDKTSISNRLLTVPKGGVKMKSIYDMGYYGKEVSELVYDFLYEKADKIIIESPLMPQDESDNKNKPSDSQRGNAIEVDNEGRKILRTTDNHQGHKPLSEVEKAAIEEIINNAKTKSWGSMSGNAISAVKKLTAAKKIPWRKKLSMALSRYVNEPGNVYENTWSKRNRRQLPLPGVKKHSKKLVISVDTSGSISNQDLSLFFGQIEKLVKDFSSLTIIEWDTKVNNRYTYKKGGWRRIKPKGRGGTDVQDLYNYVHKNMKNTSLLINFTDGYFMWEIENFGIPTLWALVNNSMKPPFGKVVYVVDKESNDI